MPSTQTIGAVSKDRRTDTRKFAIGFRKSVFACTVACLAALPSVSSAQNALQARPVAQDAAAQSTSLLADSVTFTGTQLVATGNIEVLQGDIRLTAQRILYDRASGALTIEGPIHLSQSGNNTVVLASAAELSSDLRDGILTSARLVIDQQFQLAAASMERVDGRYTRLARTVSSTCKVCEGSPTPLWQIRAKEVVHDSETRQIYFTNAQFRLWDVPVFYLPRLRLPDPTLERATGFMIPILRNSSTLGVGIQVPYFVALGDHKDLTISPYISTRTRSVDLRYRQQFYNGSLELNGAITQDERRDYTRGYLFANSTWDVGNDLEFGLDLRTVSDISYLLDYEIYDRDRLPSRVWLERYRADNAFEAQIIHIRSFRESEIDIEDTLPFLLGDAMYEYRFSPQTIGGTAWIELSAAGSHRTSSTDIEGMDVFRTSVEAGWQNSAIIAGGLRLDAMAATSLDAYSIGQNSTYDALVGRVTPEAKLRLSYPLQRVTNAGAHQTIEPIVQVSWAQSYGGDVPNTDSRLTEFDSGNFLDTPQYPGSDRRGNGLRGTVGMKLAHQSARGSYGLTFGRILSQNADPNYTTASGLSGQSSDILVDIYAQLPGNYYITSRALLDNDLAPNKWETRLDLIRTNYSLGVAHSYVQADVDENRDEDLSELKLNSRFKLGQDWTASASYRYDFEQARAATAQLGLEYSNECARVNLGVSRRYTDTEALDPTLNYSISIGFGAFGNSNSSKLGTCGL